MSHETSTSTKTHVRTRWPALLLALGLGVGLGYLGRPAPTVSAPPSDGGERTVAPSGSPAASAVAPATAPRPAAPPRAEIAMAAVAQGFALGVNFSGPNLAASRTLGPQYLRRALEAAVPLALINAYWACEPPDPYALQPFRRRFNAEEQYAWGVAVLAISGDRNAADLSSLRERCAQRLDASAFQRAEAHGLRLHAQFLSHLHDRDDRILASNANLGIPRLDAPSDPRLLDWPQCATGF